MTEERDTEQAGAPIDETGATETEVMAAVERAIDPADATVESVSAEAVQVDADSSVADAVVIDPAATGEIVADASDSVPVVISDLDMPSAAAPAAEPVVVAAAAPAAEQIQIATDHPMAGFYVQTPLPPEVRGNRGAGVLIALVATVGFALVYAGVISGLIAQEFPPSTFLSEGLLPILMSWAFIFPVAAFFVGLSALVLIVGRAGWWAYVLGGFFVAVLVWAAAVVGLALAPEAFGRPTGFSAEPLVVLELIGLSLPALGAALVAREATIWFGAWIGARGRKMTAKNREALAEYEERVAESQAA